MTCELSDISDPAAPVEVGRYIPAGDGRTVAVAGSFAYVMDEYRSVLKVVDISDPAIPPRPPSTTCRIRLALGRWLWPVGIYMLTPAGPDCTSCGIILPVISSIIFMWSFSSKMNFKTVFLLIILPLVACMSGRQAPFSSPAGSPAATRLGPNPHHRACCSTTICRRPTGRQSALCL